MIWNQAEAQQVPYKEPQRIDVQDYVHSRYSRQQQTFAQVVAQSTILRADIQGHESSAQRSEYDHGAVQSGLEALVSFQEPRSSRRPNTCVSVVGPFMLELQV